MTDPIDSSRERATTVLALILAALIALGAAGCGPDRSVPPASGPWAPCPHGEHRMKDGWLPWPRQWVCE